MRVGGGELSGRALERRREEQRLALGGGLGDDPVDGGLEAHVEHPVGLVEDEDPHVLAMQGAALDQVLETARGGDDDVGAGGALGLRAEADAAVDGGDRGAGRQHRLELVDDLARELAGRGEDERRRGATSGSSRSAIGTPNASVLPEPVGDWTSTSRPARTSSITSRWTAKGWSNPRG